MEETFETEQEKIVRARTKSLIVSTVLIILNFMGLVFAACYLNSLGYTANYIIDLNQYWQKILKNNYQNKKLPMDSFLVGNLTLIVYCFHQMNLLVLIWQLFFGGIIKRIKFECKETDFNNTYLISYLIKISYLYLLIYKVFQCFYSKQFFLLQVLYL